MIVHHAEPYDCTADSTPSVEVSSPACYQRIWRSPSFPLRI
ncbi:hypothetical protein [Nostoc sp. PCC 7524]|nr:hypothetical protein [Nostoc sp. PCC 7524]